jgi:hypothetical protein
VCWTKETLFRWSCGSADGTVTQDLLSRTPLLAVLHGSATNLQNSFGYSSPLDTTGRSNQSNPVVRRLLIGTGPPPSEIEAAAAERDRPCTSTILSPGVRRPSTSTGHWCPRPYLQVGLQFIRLDPNSLIHLILRSITSTSTIGELEYRITRLVFAFTMWFSLVCLGKYYLHLH